MNRFPSIEQLKSSKCSPLNPQLFEETAPAQKCGKFGNTAVEIDGYRFDSKKESRRYIQLKEWQAYGLIDELGVHPVFDLSVCKYEGDFIYRKNGTYIVEDVKSKATRRLSTYRLKKKLMKAEKNIEIKEV